MRCTRADCGRIYDDSLKQCPYCGEKKVMGYVPKGRKKYVQRPRPGVTPTADKPSAPDNAPPVIKPASSDDTEYGVVAAPEEVLPTEVVSTPAPTPETVQPAEEPSLPTPEPVAEPVKQKEPTQPEPETIHKPVAPAATPPPTEEKPIVNSEPSEDAVLHEPENKNEEPKQTISSPTSEPEEPSRELAAPAEMIKRYFGKLFAYYQGDTKENVELDYDFNADGFYDDTPSLVPPTRLKMTFRRVLPYIAWSIIFLASVIYFISLVV